MFSGKKLFKKLFNESFDNSEDPSSEDSLSNQSDSEEKTELDELRVKLELVDSNPDVCGTNIPVDSGVSLVSDKKDPVDSGGSISSEMSSHVIVNDHCFTLFNFHPVTTTLKIPELKSSDSGDYRSWKLQLRSITLGYGLDCLLFKDNAKSLVLAVENDRQRHRPELVEDNWKAVNRRLFASIQQATQAHTGEAFYMEFEGEQEARPSEFIMCNCYLLMNKLDAKFDSWDHMKSSRMMASLFTELSYKKGDDPTIVLDM